MSDGMNMRQGRSVALNIAAATQVSTVPKDATLANARLVKIIVTTPGTTAGSANDVAPGTAPAAANLLASIPNVVGPIALDIPVQAGILVTPGTGQVVNVVYD